MIKETKLINIDEETPVPSPIEKYPEYSPQNSPVYHFEEGPSRISPGIDPVQQQIYSYVESLERSSSMSQEIPVNPQEPLIEILKRDNYELETLNKHIKNVN